MKLPRYLSGAIYAPLTDYPDDFGFMRTPNMGNKNVPALPWAADNGCFSVKGERAFALDSYLAWLRDQDVASCLFATAPDKVGDAAETIRRAAPAMPLIRELGYPVAFVAQNGLEQLEVPWDAFDVLFIGGTTEWKLGPAARAIAIEARRAGKLVHNGRVNSYSVPGRLSESLARVLLGRCFQDVSRRDRLSFASRAVGHARAYLAQAAPTRARRGSARFGDSEREAGAAFRRYEAMEEKGYNGWTNYETWCVKLWMDNDESEYHYWNEQARERWEESETRRAYPEQPRIDAARIWLASQLKDHWQAAAPDLGASPWADLLGSALSEVDWYEIAQALLDDQARNAA